MRYVAPRARSAVLWALTAFAGLQLALNVVADVYRPAVRDPELAVKRAVLEARLAEAPDRPLVLALGSSRLGVGFRPELLGDGGPLVFNYAFVGAGPVRQHVCLEGLLREGVRPTACILEVMPAFLGLAEESWLRVEGLAWHDLAVLGDDDPGHVRRWLWSRLTPAHTHRHGFLGQMTTNESPWDGLDACGWWRPFARESVSPTEYRHGLKIARAQYERCLGRFAISPERERALEELVRRCREAGMATVLVTMPEAEAFRGWYSPQAEDAVVACLTRLSRHYAVPWIDARAWLPDDCFLDGHHLLRPGADTFTRRFAVEALGPAGLPSPGM
jgi:hypothetical protein